jgi:HAD superfamily hydrolase (TIGR01509 family)
VPAPPEATPATPAAPELAGVLFDMDGTLVDSEKVWDVGLAELADHYGSQLSAAARARMVGSSMLHSMAILHEDIGQPWRVGADSLIWLERRVKELFVTGLIWRPGAAELLHEVGEAGIPAALVTATSRHLVEVALQTIGRQHFAAVVCGDEVDEGKPHPCPYLTAATLLGVPIERCVAIEDSPTGIASAHAAGAVVLAVPSEVELADQRGVTQVESLAGVDLEYLRRLVRERFVGGAPGGTTHEHPHAITEDYSASHPSRITAEIKAGPNKPHS